MRLRPLAVAAISVALLAGCSFPPGPAESLQPTPTPSATGSPSHPTSPEDPRTTTPSRSEPRSAEPAPDATLPSEFTVPGDLVDHADVVVRELHRVSGWLPALKLDVTAEQATLTVVDDGGAVRSYRWRDGVVGTADSDVQYLGQVTFNPTRFPLHDLRRIFDVAALQSSSSESQVLQVVEYRGGEVYMTVTTRPESRTVFFNGDGTVVKKLGTSSVADIAAGLAAVTSSTQVVLTVGFNIEQGYWADVPKPGGVLERRMRIGNLPMFSAQRTETLGMEPFDPDLLDAAVISKAIAQFRTVSDQACAVEVDNRHRRVQPVIRYDCGGTIHHTDLRGRDLSAYFD
ncbi:hypothetical protein LKO27_09165 [Tessaracoccus sp. OS52]|uniref:hypothetical protein n=1 Tax=Tessaracoccus sp. OS52 TaxID=2886691 RepID=UPI001D11A6EB|nr:hypothetical protein [Tessaracoccus sp. OS52]MCC2593576.1 hypothetical protein [Tessaracoccus sp. OS52]